MIIDAHQHIWDPARAHYDWLAGEDPSLQRAIGVTEVVPALRRCGIDATVWVQSGDTAADTDLMLQSLPQRPDVRAVVGFLPLDAPVEVERGLQHWRDRPILVGVRNLIHTKADPRWILRDDVTRGLELIQAAGLTFDFVPVRPEQLACVPELSARHPDLNIVLDHLAKPPIGLGTAQPWWDLIARAAENPLVHAKISGLYSATADPASFTTAQLRPLVDHALDVFGPARLMVGSDWPICEPLGGYERMFDTATELLAELTAAERARIRGGTAAEFYGITEPGPG